jgi:hypothetical protein
MKNTAVDALPLRIKLHVSMHDLKNYDYRNHNDCACARALKRAFPQHDSSVGGSEFDLAGSTYEIPLRAAVELYEVGENSKPPRAFWFVATREDG